MMIIFMLTETKLDVAADSHLFSPKYLQIQGYSHLRNPYHGNFI